MKTAIYCSVLTLVSLWTLNSFGQGTCHNNNGGGYPNGGQQGYPYDPATPYGQSPYSQYPSQVPATYPSQFGSATYPNAAPQLVAAVAAPAPQGPTARITVVSANSSASALASLSSHAAKLTVVADEPAAAKPIEVATTEPAVDETIASLVGTWKAVARQGDGQLTTVELHLDNRGWAELTVPGSDGKPSITKSRVNLENEELKLTDADKVVSLGKLVDFNSRQMVLERAEGQVTFVRL